MTSFGNNNYVNYKHDHEMPQWMKAERMDYCEHASAKKLSVYHILTHFLFSIFL